MPVTQSRLGLARAAIRPEMKGRVMLSGPSGAGKTYTGLLIAEHLVGPDGRILVIDTEKESALTYAEIFTFEHLRWNAPYDAAALAATLKEAGHEYDAIIVDSFSHFWRKQGGILDVAGGRFTGWKDARPMQEDVIEAVLEADAHMIVCCRSKQEHVQENVNGKIEVRKLGMKAQQDDDLEYEVNVSLEIDMTHRLSVSKSRTNAIPTGSTFTPGHSGDFATQYRDWLRGGEPVASNADVEQLAATLNLIEDQGERRKAKAMFLDCFGRPEFLLVSRLKEAQEWVADRVEQVALPAERAPDAVPEEPSTEDGAEPAPAAGEAAATPAPPEQSTPAPQTATAPQGEAMGPADLIGPWLHSLTAGTLKTIALESGIVGIGPSTTPGAIREALDGFYHMVLDGETTDPRACTTCGGYTGGHVPPIGVPCHCEPAGTVI